MVMLLTCTGIRAQLSAFNSNLPDSTGFTSPIFYTCGGDSVINRIVRQEADYLSATFMISPNLYFYKTYGEDLTLAAFKTTPNLQDYNIFLDMDTACGPQTIADTRADIIIRLAQQFAATLVKKYKLGLTPAQESQFAAYITGYYLVKRCHILNDTSLAQAFQQLFNTNTILVLNTLPGTTWLRQGYDDGKNAMQKHITITVRDIINHGLYLVAEP
ncbi:hypothetical protein GCM10007352_28900 [Mucilaginibacter phyllosphaerae]|nr:hypothetical protein GCM10007352_28900 [Mucilaginibacter phyllosphaerae]